MARHQVLSTDEELDHWQKTHSPGAKHIALDGRKCLLAKRMARIEYILPCVPNWVPSGRVKVY